jgi:hypothetical protein
MCCIVPKNAIVLVHQFEIMDTRVYVVIVLLFLFSTCTQLQAQGNNKSDTLYGQIAHMDSLLFNAFNSRDIKTFEKLFFGGTGILPRQRRCYRLRRYRNWFSHILSPREWKAGMWHFQIHAHMEKNGQRVENNKNYQLRSLIESL